MVVYEPQEARGFAAGEWRGLRPGERAREEARIRAPLEGTPELEVRRWAILQDNLRRLHAGGVASASAPMRALAASTRARPPIVRSG
jgi:hypothetical protein